MKLRHLLVVSSLVGSLGGGTLAANAQGMMPEWVAGNSTYIMTLHIGPAEPMVTPAQSASGMVGEVLANSGPNGMALSMPAPTAQLNQTHAPNHHIAVQIDRRGSRNPATDLAPSLLVVNQATGDAQRFDNVPAMYDPNVGASDYHYGVNAYIPDGTYTITVLVGNQSLSFSDISIAGGGAASAMAAAPAMVSASVPTTAAIAARASMALESFGQETQTAQQNITQAFSNLAGQR